MNIPFLSGLEFEKKVRLASGAWVTTKGCVTLSWSFGDEPDQEHLILFQVPEKCVHNVLLGHPFLKETETMTTHQNRIKRTILCSPERGISAPVWDIHAASSNHATQCTVKGWLDGQNVQTLADTGSQVNIMSAAYARAGGFRVDCTGQRGTFRFIDGK